MKNDDYLSINESLEFIEECHKNKKAIIGFEGFIREGKYVIPQLDCIADFSSLLKTETSWEEIVDISYKDSKRILSEKINDTDWVYEFVIFDENKWNP